ncbi:MAG: glycosyltransferase family 4 protein [Candidatus Margulisiibacteriota bacterium]
MNIAIFTDTYHPQINGVVTSVDTFTHEFEKNGHSVLIAGPKMPGGKRSTAKIWRFNSMVFPFQREHRVIWPYSRKLCKFKDLKIDVIHAQTPFSMGYLALHLGAKYNIPVVHTYHTFFAEYLHYLPLPNVLTKAYAVMQSRRFCNRCDQVVVPSQAMKNTLNSYGITTPIDVIPTGVEIDTIPYSSQASAFREAHQIPADRPLCIFVGRLGKEKNVYFLLDAFRQVLKTVPNALLLVVGDGPELKGMRLWAHELKLDQSVRFVGYLPRNEVFTAYAASDLILFPSKTETQGLSLLEGLAMGKPAVCLNAMGVKDILEGNVGGFLTEDHLPEFVEKASALLTDSALYTQKSQEARTRAAQFSAASMAEKMIGVYESAIAAHKKGEKR